jgi:hypothetical protein
MHLEDIDLATVAQLAAHVPRCCHPWHQDTTTPDYAALEPGVPATKMATFQRFVEDPFNARPLLWIWMFPISDQHPLYLITLGGSLFGTLMVAVFSPSELALDSLGIHFHVPE